MRNLTGRKEYFTVPRKVLLHLIYYTKFGDAVVKSLPKLTVLLVGPLGCGQWIFFVWTSLKKMDHFCSKPHAHKISHVSFKCKMSLLRFWVLKYLWRCIGTFTQLYLSTVKFPWFFLSTLWLYKTLKQLRRIRSACCCNGGSSDYICSKKKNMYKCCGSFSNFPWLNIA